MPDSVANIISTLQARVRDPQGNIHTNDFVRNLVSRCQQIINDYLRLVIIEGTMNTNAYQNLYTFTIHLPNTISVLSIKDEDRDLDQLNTLDDLKSIDLAWHRRAGHRHEAFLQLGETYLLLWPAKPTNSSVTVVSTKLTRELTSVPQDNLEISTEKTPLLVDLVEVLMLVKQRDLGSAQAKLDQYVRNLGLELR